MPYETFGLGKDNISDTFADKIGKEYMGNFKSSSARSPVFLPAKGFDSTWRSPAAIGNNYKVESERKIDGKGRGRGGIINNLSRMARKAVFVGGLGLAMAFYASAGSPRMQTQYKANALSGTEFSDVIHVFPAAADGGGYASTMSILNTSSMPFNGTVKYYGNNFDLEPVFQVGNNLVSQYNVYLAPGGSITVKTAVLGDVKGGFMTLNGDNFAENAALTYDINLGYLQTLSVNSGIFSDKFSASASIDKKNNINTAFALVNFGIDSAVNITLKDESGNTVKTASIPIGANQRLSEYLWQAISGIDNFKGSANYQVVGNDGNPNKNVTATFLQDQNSTFSITPSSPYISQLLTNPAQFRTQVFDMIHGNYLQNEVVTLVHGPTGKTMDARMGIGANGYYIHEVDMTGASKKASTIKAAQDSSQFYKFARSEDNLMASKSLTPILLLERFVEPTTNIDLLDEITSEIAVDKNITWHWPIKIYLNENDPLAHADGKDWPALLKESLEAWENCSSSLKGKLFTYVSDKTADFEGVEVVYMNNYLLPPIRPPPELNVYALDSNGNLYTKYIQLQVNTIGMPTGSTVQIGKHEWGHVLGFVAEDSNPGHIMNAVWAVNNIGANPSPCECKALEAERSTPIGFLISQWSKIE